MIELSSKYLFSHSGLEQMWLNTFYLEFNWILLIHDEKKYMVQLKKNKDGLENFKTREKWIHHILPPLKPYNFCIKQFFIRWII